jgi:hypothetical protein
MSMNTIPTSAVDVCQTGRTGRSRRWRAILLGSLFLLAPAASAVLGVTGIGCESKTKPIIIKGPTVQPVADSRWGTMRAVHRVFIDAAIGDGREQNNVRGMIAVERPDRFRLQALGPGGVQLFDIVKVGGEARVIQSLAGAGSSLQQKVLLSIAADLSAAYDLEPKLPSRVKNIGLKEGELRIVETERTVRCMQFKEVQGQSVPTHMEIDNTALNYKVIIDVESATLDEKLDPSLFRMPR